MNTNIMRQVSGGQEYDTVYSAGALQDSSAGTTDVGDGLAATISCADNCACPQIVNKVTTTLQSNPSTCFLLEGYSQGAAATVNALPKLTGAAFDAVKGVFLIGDPIHKPGLACNVDSNGGTSTDNANGLEALLGTGIPAMWVFKTLDVCAFGDGVCDTSSGFGITIQHLSYPFDHNVQSMGTKFGTTVLTGGTYTP